VKIRVVIPYGSRFIARQPFIRYLIRFFLHRDEGLRLVSEFTSKRVGHNAYIVSGFEGHVATTANIAVEQTTAPVRSLADHHQVDMTKSFMFYQNSTRLVQPLLTEFLCTHPSQLLTVSFFCRYGKSDDRFHSMIECVSVLVRWARHYIICSKRLAMKPHIQYVRDVG
jgi:hypothetical protein